MSIAAINACTRLQQFATQQYRTHLQPGVDELKTKVQRLVQENPLLGTVGAGVLGTTAVICGPTLLATVVSAATISQIAGAAGGVISAGLVYRVANPSTAIVEETPDVIYELIEALRSDETISTYHKIRGIEERLRRPEYGNQQVQKLLKEYLEEIKAIEQVVNQESVNLGMTAEQQQQEVGPMITEILAATKKSLQEKLDLIQQLNALYPAAKNQLRDCMQQLITAEAQMRGLNA